MIHDELQSCFNDKLFTIVMQFLLYWVFWILSTIKVWIAYLETNNHTLPLKDGYWSIDVVRLVLIICPVLFPRRPARYTRGLGTRVDESLLVWQAASLGGNVCVLLSRLMWLRPVCMECVTVVPRLACVHRNNTLICSLGHAPKLYNILVAFTFILSLAALLQPIL